MEQSESRRTLKKIALSIDKVISPISKWTSVVSMVSLLAMMLLVTSDVTLRRAFNSPIFGSYELGQFMLTVIIYTAVAYVMSRRGHIVVNTLTIYFPRRLYSVVTGIAYFLSLILLAVIFWGSINYGLAEFKVGDTSMLLGIPIAPFIFILAYGIVLTFFATLFHLIYILAGVEIKYSDAW